MAHDRIQYSLSVFVHLLVPRLINYLLVILCVTSVLLVMLSTLAGFATTFGHILKIAKRYYQLIHVCLSARMEQLDSHWTDFHEIWYSSIFRKSGEKIQVSLISDKNNGYFTSNLCLCSCLSYPACKQHLLAAILYCHLGSVCLSVSTVFFFTLPHKRQDFREKRY